MFHKYISNYSIIHRYSYLFGCTVAVIIAKLLAIILLLPPTLMLESVVLQITLSDTDTPFDVCTPMAVL